MKYRSIRLMISLVTFLTLCLVLPSGSVRAEGEEGEEYLCVTAEVRDIGGELPEDASFLITFAPKDEADTVSPLPDKPQTILKAGETDEFRLERAAFTEPGDYLYTMKQEKATGDDNVITEEITYNVTVRVVNGDSGLNATVDIRKDGQNDKFESAIFSNNDKRAIYKQSNQGNLNDNNLDDNNSDDNNSKDGNSKDGNSSDDLSDTGVPGLFPPRTGEAFPYWPMGLLGLAALLGAWSIGRSVKYAQKAGNEQ